MSRQTHRRRMLVSAAKLLLAGAILIVLIYSLRGNDVFVRLWREPKHWGLLGLAQLCVIVGITLNYIRWYLLVRALELDFHLRDALRLGSLGHLLNQISPGSVGGDLFKAMFIAKEQPKRRTEAVATVIIDRAVGLYGILVVATAGQFIVGIDVPMTAALRTMATVVASFAAVGTLGILLLMTPAFTSPPIRNLAGKIPGLGATLVRLIEAAAVYRARRRYLFAAIGIACCTHTLLVTSIWLTGRGLPVTGPDLGTTFLVGPLSLCAGAVPLTPSGLGTFEAAMEELYRVVGCARGVGAGVAITYRAMTYVMAGLGAVYYVTARKAVSGLLRQAEIAEQLESATR